MIANGIPVEYYRLKAGHQTFDRFFSGDIALIDREIQFIYAVTQNEGCINSHPSKAGKSACHLAGITEVIDGKNLTFDSCFNNLVEFGGHQYALCSGVDHSDQFPMDRPAARAHCVAHGADLVKVESAAENDFIKNWAISENLATFTAVWFGANDIVTEGSWVWNDETTPFWLGTSASTGGVPVGGAYSNWFNTQPNNLNGREHYGSMRGGVDIGLWQDSPCTDAYAFVCEFQ